MFFQSLVIGSVQIQINSWQHGLDNVDTSSHIGKIDSKTDRYLQYIDARGSHDIGFRTQWSILVQIHIYNFLSTQANKERNVYIEIYTNQLKGGASFPIPVLNEVKHSKLINNGIFLYIQQHIQEGEMRVKKQSSRSNCQIQNMQIFSDVQIVLQADQNTR